VAIPDRGIPGPNSIDTATRTIGAELEHGGHVAVHCRAGIGRSCLIAAAVLVTGGYSADEAWAAVGRARGLAVPETAEQRAWLATFEGRHRAAKNERSRG